MTSSAANIRKQLPTNRSTRRLFCSWITQHFLVLFIGAELESKCDRGFCWGSMNTCPFVMETSMCLLYINVFWHLLGMPEASFIPFQSVKPNGSKWLHCHGHAPADFVWKMAPPNPCVEHDAGETMWNWAWHTSGLHNLTHITSNIIIHYIIHLSPLETLDKHTSHWSHETKVCLPRFDLPDRFIQAL